MWQQGISGCAVVVLFLAQSGCQPEAPKKEAPPALVVRVVHPETQLVTEYEEFTGRTAATEVVELRARVGGYLMHVDFQDGGLVEKDQVLFRIDERPLLAEERRTAAAVAQAEARHRRMASQLERAQELLQRKAVTEDVLETAQFDEAEAQAALEEARAAHDIAGLNLQFATIRAPIRGRIGRSLLDVGNSVMPDDTILATIVPQENVHVYFDMDERTVLKLRRLQALSSPADVPAAGVPVQIALADADEFSLTGEVDFLDNQIDPATGTLRARANLQNPDGLLSPGLFVRVRFPVGGPVESLLIPEEAMASDQGRPFVYVVGRDGEQAIAEARNVEPGPLVGQKRVIRTGIEPADRIIVTGLQRLRRRMEIDPQPLAEPASVTEPASRTESSGTTLVAPAETAESTAAVQSSRPDRSAN